MLENVVVIMPAYNAGAAVERVFERLPEKAIPLSYGLDVLKVTARWRRGYYHRLLGVAKETG